jgi:hypothetical protein
LLRGTACEKEECLRKLYEKSQAAHQAADEASHVDACEIYLHDKIVNEYLCNPELKTLLNNRLRARFGKLGIPGFENEEPSA